MGREHAGAGAFIPEVPCVDGVGVVVKDGDLDGARNGAPVGRRDLGDLEFGIADRVGACLAGGDAKGAFGCRELDVLVDQHCSGGVLDQVSTVFRVFPRLGHDEVNFALIHGDEGGHLIEGVKAFEVVEVSEIQSGLHIAVLRDGHAAADPAFLRAVDEHHFDEPACGRSAAGFQTHDVVGTIIQVVGEGGEHGDAVFVLDHITAIETGPSVLVEDEVQHVAFVHSKAEGAHAE